MYYNSKKTHCKRGHPLTPDNLLPYELSKGVRSCKACWTIREEKRKEKKIKKPKANQNTYKEYCIRGHPLFGDNIRIDKNGKRICRTCKRFTAKNIYHNKGGKEYQSKWQKDHPDKVSEYNSNWREKNPNYSTEWDKKNPEKRKAIDQKFRKTDKRRDWKRVYDVNYYATHPEFRAKRSEYNKQYRIENPQSGAGYPEDIVIGMMERRVIDKNICQWYGCGLTPKDCSIEVNHIFSMSKYPEHAANPYYMICYCEYHHAYWHYIKGDHYWKMICPELAQLIKE